MKNKQNYLGKKVKIKVSTPGPLEDHIFRGNVDKETSQTVKIDNMVFDKDDIEKIYQA